MRTTKQDENHIKRLNRKQAIAADWANWFIHEHKNRQQYQTQSEKHRSIYSKTAVFPEKSADIAAVFCIHERYDITKKNGSNTDTKKGFAPQNRCIC